MNILFIETINETGLVNFVCISFELGVNIVVYVTLIVQCKL